MLFLHVKQIKRVCCIGATNLGVRSMLALAYHIENIDIHIIDKDPKFIAKWNEDHSPFEPEIAQLLVNCKGTKLHFSNDIATCINNAQVIFLADETKLQKPHLCKHSPDLKRWVGMIGAIRNNAIEGKVIIDRSPVPFGLQYPLADHLGNPN